MQNKGGSFSLFEKLKLAKRLPSPPGTAFRVLDLCRDENVEIRDIADVLKADAALSCRLLKFANSPMAGLHRQVTSIQDAVLLLGLRTVKLTALGFSLTPPAFVPNCSGFNLKRYWTESFLRAVIAKRLAREFFNVEREEAFTSALLAKIGQLTLALSAPEEYGPLLKAAGRDEAALLEAESCKFGIDHGQFGAKLLSDWDLPEVLVQAVQAQGGVASAVEANPTENGNAQVVRAANGLLAIFTGVAEEFPGLREVALIVVEKQLHLNQKTWQPVADEILDEFQQVADVFDIELDSQAEVMSLYADAQEEAARVGMAAQIESAEAVKANVDLLRRATTDGLTGISNRAKFDEKIGELVGGLRRDQGHFALFMLDIDHFKKFNDTHGHQAGDRVLQHVAGAIKELMREVDMVARYGGEEFVVLAPHTDRKGACAIAARVRQCVESLRVDVDGKTLSVTVSQGLATTLDYSEVPDASRIIADADKQLYLSKKAGRNTWSYRGHTAVRVAEPVASG